MDTHVAPSFGEEGRKGFVMFRRCSTVFVAATLLAASAQADLTESLQPGSVKLTSIGPLTFGPDGVLFVSDPTAATIYAIDTGDRSGNPEKATYDIRDVRTRIADRLGSKPEDVQINDMAVNPLSGNVYLSVTRGSGPEATAIVLRVSPDGEISEVALTDVKSAKASLPNAPESKDAPRGNPRTMSVTDLAYVDGRVFVAGLSNEEFASKLRAIPFPFSEVNVGTSVEIYHGAHGAFETQSPVRTFAAYMIGGEPYLLASYTCTPLVKFPISELKPGAKLKGTTIAELGNRNRPLDMFVYKKGGKDFILMANSSRGLMKITTDNIDKIDGITEPVRGGSGTAGLTYETIAELKGITQLEQLNAEHAVAVFESGETGKSDLRTIPLP